jgi:hypothetical protein
VRRLWQRWWQSKVASGGRLLWNKGASLRSSDGGRDGTAIQLVD